MAFPFFMNVFIYLFILILGATRNTVCDILI